MHDERSILGLATIRSNRGITLEQISGSTKISVRSLEAIERGEFRKLPGGIYATSYIRQYARAIDYPEDDILECYRLHLAGEPVNQVRSQKPGSRSQNGGGARAKEPAGPFRRRGELLE